MGLIKNHLKKMAANAIGGSLGSLLSGSFNDKIAGSALSLGKNFAKIKEEANYVFEENQYSFGQLAFPEDLGSENSSNGHYMIFYINVPEKTMAADNSQGRVVGKDLGSPISSQVNGGKIRSLYKSLSFLFLLLSNILRISSADKIPSSYPLPMGLLKKK